MSDVTTIHIKSNATLIGSIDLKHRNTIPLFMHSLSAGTPCPSSDDVEDMIDLNCLCVKHPTNTVLYRTGGQSMTNKGIFDGDYLVVDKSIEPRSGLIVAADYFGETLVKELLIDDDGVTLIPHNRDFEDLLIECPEYFKIVGVVTWVLSRRF